MSDLDPRIAAALVSAFEYPNATTELWAQQMTPRFTAALAAQGLVIRNKADAEVAADLAMARIKQMRYEVHRAPLRLLAARLRGER